MSRQSTPIKLSSRSLHVLTYIACIAAAGGVTPTNDQIDEAIATAGLGLDGADFKQRSDVVAYELERLALAGRLRLIGRQRTRVFLIADTGLQTKPRGKPPKELVPRPVKVRAQTAADRQGWPSHRAADAASYDAAMKLGAPIRIKGPSDAQRVFRSIGAPAAMMSLVGCSAAEACA